MNWRLFLATLSLTLLSSEGGSNESLSDIFYTYVEDNLYPCFRLTNATHQIGCSGSASNTRGVVYYMNDSQALAMLKVSAPHSPYIALLEPALFTGDIVLKLKEMEPVVKGIIVRHVPDLMASNDLIPPNFSPEKQCPNDLFGEDSSGCKETWNPYGTNLLFTDFGDFPIFAMDTTAFDDLVKCYDMHGGQARGGNADFPLCSVELTADMAVAKDTPTCFRRQGLPIPYLNGVGYCQALGDYSVWGSLFNLTDSTSDNVILLTAKLDSVSFFPGVLSLGASSEVAAIATLLAVIDQLGAAKRSGNVVRTDKRILYSFLHGESWDYIGSSRMAFDMKKGNFPHKIDLPRIGLNNLSSILELGQLGLISDNTVFVHGSDDSALMKLLKDYAVDEGLSVNTSAVEELPPASLQRFLREGVKDDNPNFAGSVLTSFDSQFDNKFFGSRFDNIHNFGNKSMSEVSMDLAKLATAIAKAVLTSSGPECVSSSCDQVAGNMSASPQLIEDVLTCFLSDNNCDLFKRIFINQTSQRLFSNNNSTWISRYVTVDSLNNTETVILQQLTAYLSANTASEQQDPVNCSACLSKIIEGDDKTVNVTWMQYSDRDLESLGEDKKDLCLCIESFTYTHSAISPAFDFNYIGYGSQNYSTWTESNWNSIKVRSFLVTYRLQEVEFLLLGIFLTAVTLLLSVQFTRKGTLVFDSGLPYNRVTEIE